MPMLCAVCEILVDISVSAFCRFITSVWIVSAVCSNREFVLSSKSLISDNVWSAVRSRRFVRLCTLSIVSLIELTFAECFSVPCAAIESRLLCTPVSVRCKMYVSTISRVVLNRIGSPSSKHGLPTQVHDFSGVYAACFMIGSTLFAICSNSDPVLSDTRKLPDIT